MMTTFSQRHGIFLRSSGADGSEHDIFCSRREVSCAIVFAGRGEVMKLTMPFCVGLNLRKMQSRALSAVGRAPWK